MTKRVKQHQIKVTLPSNLYNEYKQLVLETTSEINLSQFTRFLIRKAVNQEKSNTKDLQLLRSRGLTYSEIGQIYNISRQAVQQRLKDKWNLFLSLTYFYF